jgi:hypothetical protein
MIVLYIFIVFHPSNTFSKIKITSSPVMPRLVVRFFSLRTFFAIKKVCLSLFILFIIILLLNNTTFKFTLPQIPVALGKNEGLATLNFSNNNTPTTFGAVPLSMNQVGYQDTLRPIQNKVVYWPQGQEVYMSTGIPLTAYKANVRMVSGGDSTDLNSTLIVPDDYMPFIVEYIRGQLAFERSRPIDTSNDGVDNNN